ncbi:MAG: MarR family transcriptional regulator [Planctomycetota bacterium]|nr:MarR family transcriptional regulator [Planctomycetota bacterium]
MTLSPAVEKFVLHWGEMGASWGINRTVAQIHALLYVSPRPLNAEEIAQTLRVARSNVSTSLRELQGWGIIRPVHVLGDRRDHFESMRDVWEMFQIVLTERKRREIDPTIALLRECVAEAERAEPEDRLTRERLAELLGFFEAISNWYDQIRVLPTKAVIRFVSLGGKVRRLLGIAS